MSNTYFNNFFHQMCDSKALVDISLLCLHAENLIEFVALGSIFQTFHSKFEKG